MRRMMSKMTKTKAKLPVAIKQMIQEHLLSSRMLHATKADRLPKFELMAHNPISKDFLSLLNQLPITAMQPGRPVAWKNPLRAIATNIRGTLKFYEKWYMTDQLM